MSTRCRRFGTARGRLGELVEPAYVACRHELMMAATAATGHESCQRPRRVFRVSRSLLIPVTICELYAFCASLAARPHLFDAICAQKSEAATLPRHRVPAVHWPKQASS